MTFERLRTHGRRRLVRGLALLVGLHSTALGLAMLLVPGWMIDTFGFPAGGSTFFASQSGVFLLILGACYLLALRAPELLAVLLLSKLVAVAFLVAHAVLGGPPILWAAAAGDGTMLAVVAWALGDGRAARRFEERLAGRRSRPDMPSRTRSPAA